MRKLSANPIAMKFGVIFGFGMACGALVAASLTTGAFAAAASDVTVSDVWLKPPPAGAKTAAVYLTVKNEGIQPIDITGVSVDGAGGAEIHESVTDAKGVASMRPLPHLVVLPGARRVLAPGGIHVMVYDLSQKSSPGAPVIVHLKLADGREASAAVGNHAK
jgi:copper(I)-binding protein